MCLSAHARFVYGGRWRSDLDHDLCPRCWMALRDREALAFFCGRIIPDASSLAREVP